MGEEREKYRGREKRDRDRRKEIKGERKEKKLSRRWLQRHARIGCEKY